MLSSAVLVPSPPQSPPPQPQSQQPTSKRPFSAISSPPPPTSSAHDTKRRRSGNIPTAKEERARGQRLFSGLLNTLAQSNTRSGAPRRSGAKASGTAQGQPRTPTDGPTPAAVAGGAERLQPQVQRRELSKEELAVIHARRQREHEEYERVAQDRARENRRLRARFLRTEAQPRLFYRPWQWSKDEKARIEAQEAEVQRKLEEERLGQEREGKERMVVDGAEQEKEERVEVLSKSLIDEKREGEADGMEIDSGPKQTAEVQIEEVKADQEEVAMVDEDPTKQPETATEQEIDPGPAVQPAPTPDNAENDEMVEETGEDVVIY